MKKFYVNYTIEETAEVEAENYIDAIRLTKAMVNECMGFGGEWTYKGISGKVIDVFTDNMDFDAEEVKE